MTITMAHAQRIARDAYELVRPHVHVHGVGVALETNGLVVRLDLSAPRPKGLPSILYGVPIVYWHREPYWSGEVKPGASQQQKVTPAPGRLRRVLETMKKFRIPVSG